MNEFKATLNAYNGIAKANLFRVIIHGKDRGRMRIGDLHAFCKETTLPGLNLKTFEYANNNYGLPQMLPYGISSEPLNCTFMLDSNHAVMGFFHAWMQEIINYDVSNPNMTVNGMSAYEIGYMEDYATTMEIWFYSSDNINDKYVARYFNAFPTNVTSLNLAWDDNDNYVSMPVQFSYSGMQLEAGATGNGSEALDRLKQGISGVYFQPGKTMHTNDSRSATLRDFIDIETRIKQRVYNDGKKLLDKLL